MCPFSCVLWAIFLVLSASVLRQIARYLPITEAKMPQKLIPNHRTINSKQLLRVICPTGEFPARYIFLNVP
ncbi:unknown [Bacteroides sp. CAG:702]|nr:unknown [Bacteroides sp. CAG:702]